MKCDTCELNQKQNRVLVDQDFTEEALQVDEVVSHLKRARKPIGQIDLVAYLRGSKSKKLVQLTECIQDLPHYGRMKHLSITDIERLVRNMVLKFVLEEVHVQRAFEHIYRHSFNNSK